MNSYDPRYILLQEEKLQSMLKKEQSIVSVARGLNVSRQKTIHKWPTRYRRYGTDSLIIRRKKRQNIAHNRTSIEIELLVEHVAQEYWQDGVETLRDWIACEYNISLHPTIIYRILKRNNIRYTNQHQNTQKNIGRDSSIVIQHQEKSFKWI